MKVLPILLVLLVAPACSRIAVQRATDLSLPPKPPGAIRVVSANTHGLPSLGRAQRIHSIGELMRALSADIVALQEAFFSGDREVLKQASNLTYGHYFRSGVFGSGLFSMSTYPISETAFRKFADQGKWFKIWQGDWWVGKGVSLTTIELSRACRLLLFNTHLQAEYTSERDQHHNTRSSQTLDLIDFISGRPSASESALLVGDFNTLRDEAPYQQLTEALAVQRLLHFQTGTDYIFYLPSTGSLAIKPRWHRIPTRDAPGKKPMSDHDFLVVDIPFNALCPDSPSAS